MRNRFTFFIVLLLMVLGKSMIFAQDITLNSFYEMARKNFNNLSDIRLEIDKIDRELLQLLVERTAFVQRAGDLKSRIITFPEDLQTLANQEENLISKSLELGIPLEISLPIFRRLREDSVKFQQRYINQILMNQR